MADNSFGVKELNLINSGTPKIDSPNNLNINAVNVAISTNATVGGNLDVDGHTELDDVNVSGVSTFAGNLKVGSGVTITPAGNADFVGVITAYQLESENRIRTVGGSFYGGSKLMFLGGNGSDMNYYAGGNSYSTHRFNHFQGNSNLETFRISQSGVNITGIATVGNFVHVPSALGGINVGSGVTISSSGDIFNTGITTNAKQIVGLATNNVIPFYYNEVSEFPSASTYHGAVAHAHNTGRLYFAHAGWKELVNKESSGVVGTGTESYNVGVVTATSFSGDGSNLTNIVASNLTVSANNTLAATVYPLFAGNGATATGDLAVSTDTGLIYNPSTGNLSATKFVGDLSDSVTSRWSVGNNGFSHYTFTGPGGLNSADDPTIYLARGQTYEFNLNASGHPFRIQTSSGGYNSGNEYTTGITNAGAAVGVIRFEVPFSAPNTLYYVCQNHSNMAGTIIIYPSI